MPELFHFFEGINNLYSQSQNLAAIWLTKPVMTREGKTCRIAPQATVCVNDGQLIDCNEENKPTHKVIACFGTLVNQFELTLLNLKTNDKDSIKL